MAQREAKGASAAGGFPVVAIMELVVVPLLLLCYNHQQWLRGHHFSTCSSHLAFDPFS